MRYYTNGVSAERNTENQADVPLVQRRLLPDGHDGAPLLGRDNKPRNMSVEALSQIDKVGYASMELQYERFLRPARGSALRSQLGLFYRFCCRVYSSVQVSPLRYSMQKHLKISCTCLNCQS